MDELTAFLDERLKGRSRLNGAAKERAQEQLAAIKAALGGEYRRLDTRRGEASLNETERAYYLPAVMDAWPRLMVKTNSVPTQAWFRDLYDTSWTISHFATELRHAIEEPGEAWPTGGQIK